MICRDGSVRAAGETAPTKGYEPPLKIDSVVVRAVLFERPLCLVEWILIFFSYSVRYYSHCHLDIVYNYYFLVNIQWKVLDLYDFFTTSSYDQRRTSSA